MVGFLKNAMDWVINKEDELAKKCGVKPEDVDKQIKVLEEKRAELRKKFEDEDAEFAHILSRLSIVKADASKCTTK
jgi:DNA-directed RNA polymerase sigma subunit (sigma70/sigma32)